MKNPETNTSENHPIKWMVAAAGVGLFLIGIALRAALPGTLADTRLLEGFGILLAGVGVIPLTRSIIARRNPVVSKRNQLAESDERAQSMRNKAGYFAFITSVVINNVVLIVYSGLTRGQPGIDVIWIVLIFLMVAPVVVFVVAVSRMNRE